MSKNFGKKLVEVRKAKGLTQDEVAKRCNVSTRTIQRIESGEVVPRAFTIKAISEALGFDFFEASNTNHEVNRKSRSATLKFYLTDLFNLKTHAMRKITILATFCLAVGFAVFAFAAKAEAQKLPNFINTPERVEVAFTHNFTIDSLVFIKNELAKRGITLSYKSVNFDTTGHLLTISASVDCGDGFSGNFSNESDPFSVYFTRGEVKEVKSRTKRYGFVRDYSKKAKKPFAIMINTNATGLPLYFVDGKEVANIDSISPNSVERISVLKNEAATTKYGDKAKNGVVEVYLKK